MPDRDLLVTWMKDAHAMERALIPVLERHAEQADARPELRARLERHVGETKRHVEILERCLQRYGEDPSATKDLIGRASGTLQSFATAPFGDRLVKNSIADYATEHFEIASYEGIRAAAERLNDDATVKDCETILEDERDMARFLSESLPHAVDTEIRRDR
jgi:ferritin-like metal-binding protein YciE